MRTSYVSLIFTTACSAAAYSVGSYTGTETPPAGLEVRGVVKPKPKPRPKPRPRPSEIPNLVFDCKKAKETCNTMCYGLRCGGKTLPFTYDKPSDKTEDARREKAGCGPKNRCISGNNKGKGLSCDEFPFASTRQATVQGDQYNRCVIAGENNSQGGQLAGFYRASKGCKGKKACKFTMSFNNRAPYKYCSAKAGAPSCKGDGNIYTQSGPVKKRDLGPEAAADEQGGDYQLASGAVVYSAHDLEIGSLMARAVLLNETLHDSLEAEMRLGTRDAALLEEDMAGNWDFVDDKVVAKL